MTKRPQLIIPAVILGVVFLVIAVDLLDRRRRLPARFLPRARGRIERTSISSTDWRPRSSRWPASSSPGSRPVGIAPGVRAPNVGSRARRSLVRADLQ